VVVSESVALAWLEMIAELDDVQIRVDGDVVVYEDGTPPPAGE
jgi:hypothetical protein